MTGDGYGEMRDVNTHTAMYSVAHFGSLLHGVGVGGGCVLGCPSVGCGVSGKMRSGQSDAAAKKIIQHRVPPYGDGEECRDRAQRPL